MRTLKLNPLNDLLESGGSINKKKTAANAAKVVPAANAAKVVPTASATVDNTRTSQPYQDGNYAMIEWPIVGEPNCDSGAYEKPVGCCFFVNDRHGPEGADVGCNFMFAGMLIGLWLYTGCWCCSGCPDTEHRVNSAFVRDYPHLITRGPNKPK